MKDLNDLIYEAYHLFSPYKMTGELAVYNDFLSQEDIVTLRTVPLQNLSRNTIYDFLDNINYKNPNLINQIRYLLPRILELIIQNQTVRHSNELTLDALSCRNANWLKAEINFLNVFAETYLQNLLLKIDTEHDFDEVADGWLSENLLMFAIAEIETNHLLNFVEKHLDNWCMVRAIVFILHFDMESGHYYDLFETKQFAVTVDEWFRKKHIHNQLTSVLQLKINNFPLDDATTFYFNSALDCLNKVNNKNIDIISS